MSNGGQQRECKEISGASRTNKFLLLCLHRQKGDEKKLQTSQQIRTTTFLPFLSFFVSFFTKIDQISPSGCRRRSVEELVHRLQRSGEASSERTMQCLHAIV
jgi:hypothetical protein